MQGKLQFNQAFYWIGSVSFGIVSFIFNNEAYNNKNSTERRALACPARVVQYK